MKKQTENLGYESKKSKNNKAKENTSIAFEIYSRERLISPGDYVALRTDLIDKKTLSCFFIGQIGRVGPKVKLDKQESETYFINFFDELNKLKNVNSYDAFATPILHLDEILKLHFKQQIANDYTVNSVKKALEEGTTLLEEYQEDLDLINKEENILINHNFMSSRFDPGNLVTIVYDFAIKQENENIVIFSGQVGMIKKVLSNNNVSVVFRQLELSMLLDKETNLEEIQDISALKKEEDWVIETTIHKSFLLPLYYTKLQLTDKGKNQLLNA